MSTSSKPILAPSAELVSRLRASCERELPRFGGIVAYLYGSQARGEATPLSDIDVAVLFREPPPEMPWTLEAAVASALQDGLRAPVQVLVLNRAPILLAGRAITGSVLLYDADPPARVDFEVRTRSRYFDFLISHREWLRTYAAKLKRELRTEAPAD